MKITRLTMTLALLATLTLFACGGDEGGGGNGGGGGGGSDTVNWDTTQPDTSTSDTHTPETTPPACAPACGAGTHCDNGTCVPDTQPPACDPPCGAGTHCDDGTCVPDTQPPACDPPCGAGTHCDNGTCVPDTQPPACDPPCAAGSTCVEGQCVAQGACAASGGVANLKGCAEGLVDVTLEGVVVTYVFEAGYFLQDVDGAAATEVYVGQDEWPYAAPAVGDVMTLHVTEYGNFKNQQEVTASDAPQITGNQDVEAMKLDISGGTVPAEDFESRVVKGSGLTVTTLGGQNGTISYGSAVDVPFRVDNPAGLCVGATFNLSAGVIVQYEDIYRIQAFAAETEIVNVDASGCASYDDSNWGFEETTETDPPADFTKGSGDFTANVTGAKAHGGSSSCELTWTSESNQDLFQGMFTAAGPGQTATFSVWVLDHDLAGRVRVSMEFYDADMAPLNKEYGGYSTDGDDWQEMVLEATVPEAAAYVRAFVRMYDVAENWQGTATVHIDDWSLAVQ